MSKRGHLQFLKDNASLNPNNGVYQNIYITSEKEKIIEGDWHINLSTNEVEKASKYLSINFISQSNFGISVRKQYKKIILTDNKDLVKDGVQAIDDEFLEWFVKNPSCEFVDVGIEGYKKNDMIDESTSYKYKITITKEEQKQHLIDIMKGDEELVSTMITDWLDKYGDPEMQKRMYSLEDMKLAFQAGQNYENFDCRYAFPKWVEQFKKK